MVLYVLKVSSWSLMFKKFQFGSIRYLHWNKLVHSVTWPFKDSGWQYGWWNL